MVVQLADETAELRVGQTVAQTVAQTAEMRAVTMGHKMVPLLARR